MTPVRIGTRKSPLAMAQARAVAEALGGAGRGIETELVGIVTEGDRAAIGRPGELGGKGIFIKALDEALIAGRLDLAVHSAKDVPSRLTDGLAIAAIPAREDVADLLVSRAGWTLETLPEGARVGTSSLRRGAQLRFFRSDLEVIPIRGNVETRLSKAADGSAMDAVLVAAAGVNRLGGAAAIAGKLGLKAERLDPAEFLPAPGQAALMLVARQADAARYGFLTDPDTAAALRMERALVAALGADCSWPVGAWARREGGGWVMDAALLSFEGKLRARDRFIGDGDETLATLLAAQVLAKGGKKILEWNQSHGPTAQRA